MAIIGRRRRGVDIGVSFPHRVRVDSVSMTLSCRVTGRAGGARALAPPGLLPAVARRSLVRSLPPISSALRHSSR
ncbi:hypothetical protein EVAR_64111_1 [Eumeta japonica]|uniref:Uncharacterized protein n=1 Tax=Eumeta variegata TaxID=151549 RepID=A0A4C1ZHT8_EUMVA|nr:hypothetical protein EVAR_64111_1 [Eumeta japonica]